MDQDRFDALTRVLGAGRSRRSLVKGLGAAALGALGLRAGAAEADACKSTGKACSKGSQCCSGNCTPAPGKTSVTSSGAICCPAGQIQTSSGHCGCPSGQRLCNGVCIGVTSDPNNCGGCGVVCPSDVCNAATCAAGHCGTTPTNAGNVCAPAPNACVTPSICDATGACAPGTSITCGPCLTCDPAQGCQPDPAQVGQSCPSNGSLCEGGFQCTAFGACAPTDFVICGQSDQCHVQGTCDPATGSCTNPAAPDGTACTASGGYPGTCQSGACVCAPESATATCSGKCGAQTNNCGQSVDCGACCTAAPNGGVCAADADCCSGVCQGGTCVATTAGTCTAVGDMCGNGNCGCIADASGDLVCAAIGLCGPTVTAANCPAGATFVLLSPGGCCLEGTCPPQVGCFTGETRIALADGTSKPIELIEVGDRVLGQSGVNRVLGVDRPRLGGQPLYALNGGPAFVTANHPFLTETGWAAINPAAARLTRPTVAVRQLVVGERLLALAGVPALIGGPTAEEPLAPGVTAAAVEAVEARRADPATPLFDLRVDGDHTYFANELLVHNK